MLRFLPRSFARMYNQLKQRPRARDKVKVHLKRKVAESQGFREQIGEDVKELKDWMPRQKLVDVVKADKFQVKRELKPVRFLDSISPVENRLFYKQFTKTEIPKMAEEIENFIEENILVLDRSVESQRNVLLAEELNEFDQKWNQYLEGQRRADLQIGEEQLKIKGLRGLDVNEFLNYISGRTVSLAETTELTTTQQFTPQISDPILDQTTGETLSPKGVVNLSNRKPDRVRFSHLTHKELANYIMYNLKSYNEGLQFYLGSADSNQFNLHLRVNLLAKLATFDDPKPDAILYDLMREIRGGFDQLGDKDLSTSLWATGSIFKNTRDVPRAVSFFIRELIDKIFSRIPYMNSMNLGYLCEGLHSLGVYSPAVMKSVITRLVGLMDLCNQYEPISQIPIYNKDITNQHSIWEGYVDWTVPKHPVPAQALMQILSYIIKGPEELKRDIIKPLILKSAKLIKEHSWYELTSKETVNALRLICMEYPEIAVSDEIRSMIPKLTDSILFGSSFYTPNSISTILQSLMNSGIYKQRFLYKSMQVKAQELLGVQQDQNQLLNMIKSFTRYSIALNSAIDIRRQPWYFMLPRKRANHPVLDKAFEYRYGLDLDKVNKIELSAQLSLAGYDTQDLIENAGNNREAVGAVRAAAYIGYLDQAGLRRIGERLSEILNYERREQRELVELLLCVCHVKGQLDWGYVTEFLNRNLDEFGDNPSLVGIMWIQAFVQTLSLESAEEIYRRLNIKTLTEMDKLMLLQCDNELIIQTSKGILSPQLRKSAYNIWTEFQ